MDIRKMDAKVLGDLIRTRRQELGLTQQQLADADGVQVHVSSVISWESGEHKPTRKFGALEKVLGPLGSRPSATVTEAKDRVTWLLEQLQQELRDQNQGNDNDKTNGTRRAG